MSKVIHKIQNNLNSLLHRGQKSKDPYNKTYFNPARLLLKTLGTSSVNPRCSNLGFSLGKKIPTKETSKNFEMKVNSISKFDYYISKNRYARIAGISSSFVLLVLFALSIYPIVRSLNSAEAVTPTNSTTSLSITSTNSASVELLVKSDSGTFASSTSSQELNFNVKTDNYAGYELTLLGKDNSYASLKNSSTNTTLTSISGSKESSEFSNGNWGYTLDGTNYRAAPDNKTGYQIEKTSTPNKDTAKTYTLGIGAKANYSTKAGTYTNTYVLAAVGNSTPYTIYYRDNTSDSSVTNLPTTQDEATSAINVNLSDTIPTRTGYTFSKWCDGTVSNNGTTCTGTSYNSGDEFGIDRTAASNVTTLYAVWTVNSYTLNITNNNTTSNPASLTTVNFGGETTITVTPNAGYYLSEVSCPTGYTCSGYTTGSDATGAQTVTVKNNGDSTSATGGTITFTAESSVDGYMQDFTADECSALSDGTTLKLGDRRDGNTYNITKINGNCWMTQNLRYVGDTGSTSGSMVMKSATSNISADKTITYADLSSGNSTMEARIHVATNSQVPSGASYTTTDMGAWYNYAATSAGTIAGDSNSTTVAQDVCPKNWRLPSDSEQSSIVGQTVAFAPVGGGGYNDGVPASTNYGFWWSANASNTAGRYRLYYNGNELNTDYSAGRGGGAYVRCIKKSASEETIDNLQGTYLQDMTPAIADTLPINTVLNLKDNRDEQSYQVAKLADGNLWMTDNLNLGATTLSTNLTSSNTNLSSTITASTFNGWKKDSSTTTYASAELVPVSGVDSTSGTIYGTLYNYCATSAGTICTESNSFNASYDICPKGWRLPTGGSSGEFQTLYNNSSYDSNAKMRALVSSGGAAFALAGNITSSTPAGQGSNGEYWSSTQYNSYSMYLLLLGTSNVNPAINGGRSGGRSIRCILNDNRTIADATYMQDVTAKMVSNAENNATATLMDSRDNQEYTVAKINEDLWMTRNLAIGCNGSGSTYGTTTRTKTLSNFDSNVSSNYSTPSSNSFSSSYTAGKIVCDKTGGARYNYYTASAGTVSGSSRVSTDTVYDICPRGWHLPTYSEFNKVKGYRSMFNPISGGYYSNSGSIVNSGYGSWWSATANVSGGTDRYRLVYNAVNSALTVTNDSPVTRDSGLYIRCVRSSS